MLYIFLNNYVFTQFNKRKIEVKLKEIVHFREVFFHHKNIKRKYMKLTFCTQETVGYWQVYMVYPVTFYKYPFKN